DAEIGSRSRSDYTLMLLQCSMGIIALLLPSLLAHRLRVMIPSSMYLLYVLFLYCAIYLGEVRSFYYNVKHWDVILHCFSGGMMGALAFSVVTLLNDAKHVPIVLSPLFVAIFAFSFSIMLGVFWEIYEFVMDGWMGLNMQKFALEGGVPLVGRAALGDTMKDLIVDAAGALLTAVIGYISLKYQKGWIEKLQIQRISDTSK
ncbi:MAG: hypothetical protein RR482_08050, partial [Clostridia bacterium]